MQQNIVFCLDMPSRYGKSDIYKTEIKANGTFGKPINLGLEINTKERESFPYIDSNNQLYFASDNHIGYGGLDIFKVNLNSEFKTVENIGKPFNTTYDDFGFIRKKIVKFII